MLFFLNLLNHYSPKLMPTELHLLSYSTVRTLLLIVLTKLHQNCIYSAPQDSRCILLALHYLLTGIHFTAQPASATRLDLT